MAGGLAQTEECFQHLNLRFRHAFSLYPLEQCISVMLAQLVIKFALYRLHLAINCLLAFRGQLAGNLFLGAAQYEWPQRMGQKPAGISIWITRRLSSQLEHA